MVILPSISNKVAVIELFEHLKWDHLYFCFVLFLIVDCSFYEKGIRYRKRLKFFIEHSENILLFSFVITSTFIFLSFLSVLITKVCIVDTQFKNVQFSFPIS